MACSHEAFLFLSHCVLLRLPGIGGHSGQVGKLQVGSPWKTLRWGRRLCCPCQSSHWNLDGISLQLTVTLPPPCLCHLVPLCFHGGLVASWSKYICQWLIISLVMIKTFTLTLDKLLETWKKMTFPPYDSL